MKPELIAKIRAYMQQHDIEENSWEEGFTEVETEPTLRDLTDILHALGGVYENMYLIMVWRTFDEWCFFGGDADLYLSLYNGHDDPVFYNVSIPFLDEAKVESFVEDVIAIAEGRKESENMEIHQAMTWDNNAYIETVEEAHGEVGVG